MTSVKNLDQILFTEKYRPETLDNCILPARIKKMLEGGIKMNMLFYGSAGIGKTTTAKALAKQFKHNILSLLTICVFSFLHLVHIFLSFLLVFLFSGIDSILNK